MAQDDIYKSKHYYERFKKNVQYLILPPKQQQQKLKSRALPFYFCKNKDNLKYFDKLFLIFESKDLSFIRRLRLLRTFKILIHATEKNLNDCDRDDISKIVRFQHTRNKSPKSKEDFIRDTKHIWKIILPDKDERGRIDEDIIPYNVRHLKPKQDKSTEKKRDDKLSFEEYKNIVSYFHNDKCIQAYITISVESLSRPQELLYTKIKDWDIKENWAKGSISEHGKEGTGIIQCFDSFPYLLAWYMKHPLKNDRNSYFFLNNYNNQLTPYSINKRLKKACRNLSIDKPITCYSLKRNGVTFDLMAGKKPQTIQHKAGWTSLKQLQIYSKMSQEDNFYIEGIKKGKITDPNIIERYKGLMPGSDKREATKCFICGYALGFEEEICPNCKRSTDREKIKEDLDKTESMEEQIEKLTNQVETLFKFAELVKINKEKFNL
ncbi:site-specific integrase [archaeon]|jgi:hypothetical protein|nr:site-specific integrase [archaeon]